MLRRISILAACGLCVSAFAFADEPTHVQTTSVAPDDPRNPTLTSDSTNLAELRVGEGLGDALATLAGTHVRYTSYGQPAYLSVRGGNPRQVSATWEGLRLDPPFGAGFDLNSSNDVAFDGASLARGPAGTHRGSGAVSGALELRTSHLKQPGHRVAASAEVGSFATRRLTGRADLSDGTTSSTARVGMRDSDGDFDFVDPQGVRHRRINNEHDRLSAAAGATTTRGAWRVAGNALHDRGARGVAGPSEFQAAFAGANLTDSRTVGVIRAARVGGNGALGALDLNLGAGAQARAMHYQNQEALLGGGSFSAETDHVAFSTASSASLWRASSSHHASLRLRHETLDQQVEQAGGIFAIDARRLTAGTGVGTEWLFWAQRLALTGGVDLELADDGGPAIAANLGTRGRLNSWLEASANAGRTQRRPNFDELWAELELLRGNPALRPEAGWVGDVGLHVARNDASLRLTGFVQVVDDEIRFVPVSAYLVEATNLLGTRALGAEATAAARLGEFETRASYTFVDVEDRQTGRALALQPTHTAVGSLSWERDLGPVVLGAHVAARGRSAIFLDGFENLSNSGFVTASAGILVRVGPLAVQARAANLADVQTAVDSLQQPLAGRSFWLSVGLEDARREAL